MLIQLFQLYKKFALQKPLEDFTTEALVGILNSDLALKNGFCKEFLNLKSERFNILTQKKYFLKSDTDCIVDIVIIGNNGEEICFIENKVNSKEGYRQLDRYIKILDKFQKEGIETKLIFCTKFSEPKTYTSHRFQQIKWYNIAQYLRNFKKNPLITSFLLFLNHYEMEQNLTITSKDLISMENLPRTLNLIKTYCERVEPNFSKNFGKIRNESGINQFNEHIFTHNRIGYYTENILEGKESGYSEILFGFSFDGYIYVQIYVNGAHNKFDTFKNETNSSTNFILDFDEYGGRIYKKQNLGAYLNNDGSDVKIETWFKDTFEEFATYMKASSLNWVVK